jgi:hypothetical protein
LDDVNRAGKEGEKKRRELIEGYRHQEIGEFITITVIVEKVKKGVWEEICVRRKRKVKKVKGMGKESQLRDSKMTWERSGGETPSVKTAFCFSAQAATLRSSRSSSGA